MNLLAEILPDIENSWAKSGLIIGAGIVIHLLVKVIMESRSDSQQRKRLLMCLPEFL